MRNIKGLKKAKLLIAQSIPPQVSQMPWLAFGGGLKEEKVLSSNPRLSLTLKDVFSLLLVSR